LGGAQRRQHGEPDLRHPPGRQRAVLLHHVVQGAGPDQLHHDPGPALVLQDVIDRDHVRVAQPAAGAGLAHRALVELGPLLDRHVLREHDLLDRDVPMKHLIAGEPDPTHPAAADEARQPVAIGDELT